MVAGGGTLPRPVGRFFGGATIDALCSMAGKAGLDVVIGIAERDPVTHGTIYSTLTLIGSDGHVLGRHRKLGPWVMSGLSGPMATRPVSKRTCALTETFPRWLRPSIRWCCRPMRWPNKEPSFTWPLAGHIPTPSGREPCGRTPSSVARLRRPDRGLCVVRGRAARCRRGAGGLSRLLPFAFNGGSAIIDPRAISLPGRGGRGLLVAECATAACGPPRWLSTVRAIRRGPINSRSRQVGVFGRRSELGRMDGPDGPGDDGQGGDGYDGDGYDSEPPERAAGATGREARRRREMG